MERRKFIKALFGVAGGAVVAGRATSGAKPPEVTTITVRPDDSRIVQAFIKSYKENSELRRVIRDVRT